MRYTLTKGFHFSHEPRGSEAGAGPLIGRDELLSRLATRITRTDGGAFLVVGYRGVGKTSLAKAVVKAVEQQIRATGTKSYPTQLLDLWFALARPIPPADLLYQIINGLRLELDRRGLLSQFTTSFRRELDLAAARTAATLTQKSEDQVKSNLGLSTAWGWLPKFTAGRSRERRLALEQAFLPYDQSSAEQDVIRLAKALGDPRSHRTSILRWILGPLWIGREFPKLRLMFVFDELDKLDISGNGVEAFESILSELKTLLTTSRITFVFVGGRGLLDAWEKDVGRGDSVYQSVFSHFEYVPPIWRFNDQFWNQLIQSSDDGRGTLAAFKKYLAFHGRGVPRLMLTHLHEFVFVKDAGELQVEFDEFEERSFRCIAELEEAISKAEEKVPEIRGWRRASVRHGRHDRDALALRYLTDWVLDHGKEPFGVSNLLEASNNLSPMIAPEQKDSAVLADKLIGVLEAAGFLELVPAADPLATILLESGTPTATWRVPRRRLIELRLEAAEDTGTSKEEPPLAGRYHVSRMISRGARASVYEAFDLSTRQRVALKRFDSHGQDQFDHAAIENEIEIMRRLDHESLPKLIEAQPNAPTPFIALELIDGVPLDKILRDRGRLSWEHALRLAYVLLEPLQHFHDHAVLWGDVKPSNILVQLNGRLRVLDFGASRLLTTTEDYKAQAIEGTLRYMAPECLTGALPTIASEIYSFGVLLYQLVTGLLPFDGEAIPEILNAIEHSRLKAPQDVVPKINQEFGNVILRCLNRDPLLRYQSIKELADNLPSTAVTDQQLAVWFAHAVAQTTVQEERDQDATRLLEPKGLPRMARNLSHASSRVVRPRRWTNLDAGTQALPALVLSVSDPAVGERRITIQKELATIGRSPENDVPISDEGASRYHAEIERSGSTWTIKVRNSVNAPLIDGVPVTGEVTLAPGSEIQIGDTRIKVLKTT
jgi:serine/threonine protein kinase